MPTEVILALGGGGARGLAHIGVIRALDAADIRIVGVAGTSIGAMVGGIYCAGRIDYGEKYVRGLSWTRVLTHLDPALPRSGVFGGKKLEKTLGDLSGDPDFSDLSPSFCAVATNLGNGSEVRIREGSVLEAMRASMAIPGVFNPMLLEDSWMVDGALAAPIPVNAARELGDAPVVAVNVNSTSSRSSHSTISEIRRAVSDDSIDGGEKLWKRMERFWRRGVEQDDGKRMPGIIPIMSDSIAHLQNHLARYQMEVDKPDAIIEPSLGRVNLFDFHKAAILIEEGRKATEAMLAGEAFNSLESRARP